MCSPSVLGQSVINQPTLSCPHGIGGDPTVVVVGVVVVGVAVVVDIAKVGRVA